MGFIEIRCKYIEGFKKEGTRIIFGPANETGNGKSDLEQSPVGYKENDIAIFIRISHLIWTGPARRVLLLQCKEGDRGADQD